MSKTHNAIPYERQMLPILRNYDKLAEENKAMKAILADIGKVCKPEEAVQKIEGLEGQIKCLKSKLNKCRNKLNVIDYSIREHWNVNAYSFLTEILPSLKSDF